MSRFTICRLVASAVLAAGLVREAGAGEFTIALELRGRQLEGTPVAWSDTDVVLLGRDGCLWNFAPHEAKDFRKVAAGFQGYSSGDLRSQLVREFGKGFEVSGAGRYVVVHPVGERAAWTIRFDQLYRSFVRYFAARGQSPEAPRFPLIAVVFPSQSDFLQYAARDQAALVPGTLGYYSPTTNRVLLYDVASGRQWSDQWHVNAETIIHEATHQMAFNTGIHSRFAMPPLWLAEGLATMFEAPGVWNSDKFSLLQHRINRERLITFRRYVETRRAKESLATLLSTDHRFQRDPEAAYAEAWALVFFLAETSPRKLIEYLHRTASREPFSSCSADVRVRDFREVFGEDLALLEARFLRFVSQLK